MADYLKDIGSNIKRGVSNVGSFLSRLFEPPEMKTALPSPRPPGMKSPLPEPLPTRTPQPTPTPVRTPTPISNPIIAREGISDDDAAAMTPAGEVPGGTDLAMNYLQSRVPSGMTMESAFPVTANTQFMREIEEADQLRRGLANLLLLQSFFESTGGRLSSNIFGVKPPGGARFSSPLEALRYQLSPSVLGGGVGGKLNILNSSEPLGLSDVENLYSSYNPEGAYLDDLLSILRG